MFEIAIDDNVGVGSVSLENDIVNSQAVAVISASSFNLELVLSRFDVNSDSLSMNMVVRRNDRGNYDVVPENVALA